MKHAEKEYFNLSLILKFIIPLLCIGTTLNSQIVGGTDVEVGNYEAVGKVGSGCTGTLIGPKTVLTAAHCVCLGQTQPTGCRSVEIFTLTDVRPVDNPNTQVNESLTRTDIIIRGAVRVHPKYTLAKINGVFVKDHWLSNDYAIIDLEESVHNLALDIRPMEVEIPAKRPSLGDRLTIVGYGRTGDNCNLPYGVKREITKPLWEISKDNVTLRIGRTNSGSCPGDSGGPAINSNGKIVGIDSSHPGNYDPTDLGYNFIKGFENLGGAHTASPAVAHTGSGKMELFGRGTNHKLVQRSWNGSSWSGWKNLGGHLASAPAVVHIGSGKLEVFMLGKHNNELVQKSWNGSSWSGWKNLGGDFTSAPSVVHTGSGKMTVFVRGKDNKLHQSSWNGSRWSVWRVYVGEITSAPSAVYTGSDKIEVFARGGDLKLIQLSLNNSVFADWKVIGGSLGDAPSAVHVGSGRIELFMQGKHNNELVQKSWNGSKWSGWKNHSGIINSAVGLTYIDSSESNASGNNLKDRLKNKKTSSNFRSGIIEVFAIDKNKDLLYRSFPYSYSAPLSMGGILIENK